MIRITLSFKNNILDCFWSWYRFEEISPPIQFSSVFGRTQAAAALSTSTPNLSTKHQGRRPASSPSNNENQKKLKNKSLLPLKLRNHSR